MARVTKNGRQRIVSLAPSVTSILVALDGRRHLVGVTRWCADVADVGGLPRLGDCWKPDINQVLRLRPTLVIGSVPYKTEMVAKLLAAPFPFLAMNPRTLADIYGDIRMIGRLIGRTEAAERLVRAMQSDLARIAEKSRRRRTRSRVYCEAWPNPRISSPPWVAELVEIAGGTMVVAPGTRIKDRTVAEAKPEIIILAWAAAGDRPNPEKEAARMAALPGWSDLPAIRDHRVHVIRDELLNTPGPPVVQGARRLLEILHPQSATASPARRKR